MTTSEAAIMRHFRNYLVDAHEMLFFNSGLVKSHPAAFRDAMESLIEDGLVIPERRRYAYSLTTRGYQASMSA